MVYDYVRQPGDVFRPDSRIFDASQKERGKADNKSYCATQNASDVHVGGRGKWD